LRDKLWRELCEDITYGGPLVGRVFGSDHHSVYDLLTGAFNVIMHDTVTKVLGHDAYLLDADTRYGRVKAWISPDAGCNCLKWEIVKVQNQFYRDGTTTSDPLTDWVAAYEAEQVEQIDGRYVTTQAKFVLTVTDGDTQLSNVTYHYKLANIDFDPDYEAMGAFGIPLPEGTVATHKDVPGQRFIWTNGRFVPDIEDYLYRNLIGEPLPDLASLVEGLKSDYGKGQMLLLCFWDMQQRPSRKFVRELAEKAKELESKGLIVLLVQTSDVTADELQEWIHENKMLFPFGQIAGERRKVLVHWGVRAQPWLILTNKNHIVIEEGLSVAELLSTTSPATH
jgi:hypothetical protein